jgi:hypothetical protein
MYTRCGLLSKATREDLGSATFSIADAINSRPTASLGIDLGLHVSILMNLTTIDAVSPSGQCKFSQDLKQWYNYSTRNLCEDIHAPLNNLLKDHFITSSH